MLFSALSDDRIFIVLMACTTAYRGLHKAIDMSVPDQQAPKYYLEFSLTITSYTFLNIACLSLSLMYWRAGSGLFFKCCAKNSKELASLSLDKTLKSKSRFRRACVEKLPGRLISSAFSCHIFCTKQENMRGIFPLQVYWYHIRTLNMGVFAPLSTNKGSSLSCCFTRAGGSGPSRSFRACCTVHGSQHRNYETGIMSDGYENIGKYTRSTMVAYYYLTTVDV